jgi:adenosylcobinamide-phosphate synthase
MPSSLGFTAVLCGAAVLDWLVGEPPRRLHPVAWFGRLVATIDRSWTHPLAVGVVGAVVLPVAAGAVAWVLVAGAAATAPWLGAGAATLVLWTTTSLRMLLAEAAGVIVASETDPPAARERLPALVGRDPSELTPAQIRSAAVESLAENLADGLVAPLCAFALCLPISLSLATAAAAWLKAVNTMDSMLGYPGKPVGTASARLDDLAMWLPARATAGVLSLATVSLHPARHAHTGGRATVSPNAGWPMGALAGALGIRLTKPGAYDLNPAADLPDPAQSRRAIATVGRAGLLAYALATAWVVLLALVETTDTGVLG